MDSGRMQRMEASSRLRVSRARRLGYDRFAHFGPADPATDEDLGMVADMGAAETKEAIESASVAFKSWSKTTAKVRFFWIHDSPCILFSSIHAVAPP
jgi:acyl-CoA reductase-like NAD-dependent aldehyde dehydrogenase